MKYIGLLVAFAGFAITLSGLGMTADLTMRMIAALVGIAVSLVGIIGVLNPAYNKDAIWKK